MLRGGGSVEDVDAWTKESKKRGRLRLWPQTALRMRVGVLLALLVTLSVWCWRSAKSERQAGIAIITGRTEKQDLRVEQQQQISSLSSARTVAWETSKPLVLIKSFKTGSTTLATYITQVGHQRGAYFLHPEKGGWFKDGELQSRLDAGQKYDVSARHITPSTPYRVLADLLPGAVFVTIMRRPVDRFLSLFNFRDDLRRQYKTPEALVTAIQAGKLDQGDARPFCNQLAWLLSGKDVDYTAIREVEEAERLAGGVIAEAERWGVTVLLTERMSESMAVLADLMGWNMEDLDLRLGSKRVQHRWRLLRNNATDPSRRLWPKRARSRSGRSAYYTCEEGDVKSCEDAIRGCNVVDELLYAHSEHRFQAILRNVSTLERMVAQFESKPRVTEKMSKWETGEYPVNCRVTEERLSSRPSGEGKDTTNDDLYDRLHSCSGRPP